LRGFKMEKKCPYCGGSLIKSEEDDETLICEDCGTQLDEDDLYNK